MDHNQNHDRRPPHQQVSLDPNRHKNQHMSRDQHMRKDNHPNRDVHMSEDRMSQRDQFRHKDDHSSSKTSQLRKDQQVHHQNIQREHIRKDQVMEDSRERPISQSQNLPNVSSGNFSMDQTASFGKKNQPQNRDESRDLQNVQRNPNINSEKPVRLPEGTRISPSQPGVKSHLAEVPVRETPLSQPPRRIPPESPIHEISPKHAKPFEAEPVSKVSAIIIEIF